MASLKQMEKRWKNLRKKQEALQQEMKKTKRDMEVQRTNDIGRIIRRTGFPVNNMAILVGALVYAKERIDAGDHQAMDKYIASYTHFRTQNPNVDVDDLVSESQKGEDAKAADNVTEGEEDEIAAEINDAVRAEEDADGQ
ncbi:hypothetical protein [Selenomonas noxia]|uniref:hypothetical protein n=1 Tax=Selenomonas noxia TaxID=135083 RepID=UPI0028D69233|nr:hypothetical protein [Selenomonas noxia]